MKELVLPVDILIAEQAKCTQVSTGGGGVTCHDFGYGRAAGVPGPHPIHILGEVKKQTHSYTRA